MRSVLSLILLLGGLLQPQFIISTMEVVDWNNNNSLQFSDEAEPLPTEDELRISIEIVKRTIAELDKTFERTRDKVNHVKC